MNFNFTPQDTSPQMQGQAFAQVRDVFQRAAPEQAPAPLIRTPFIGLSVDPQMLGPIRKKAKPVYDAVSGDIIPTCWFGSNPEALAGCLITTATAAVDNRNGLQIILCKVGDHELRKDGVPYHMIWSHDSAMPDFPVVDRDYTWPTLEVDEPVTYRDKHGYLRVEFAKQVVAEQSYPRVMGHIEKMAEELAVIAYKQRKSTWYTLFNTSDFDFMELNIKLKVPEPKETCYLNPRQVRAQHNAHGQRFAYEFSR